MPLHQQYPKHPSQPWPRPCRTVHSLHQQSHPQIEQSCRWTGRDAILALSTRSFLLSPSSSHREPLQLVQKRDWAHQRIRAHIRGRKLPSACAWFCTLRFRSRRPVVGLYQTIKTAMLVVIKSQKFMVHEKRAVKLNFSFQSTHLGVIVCCAWKLHITKCYAFDTRHQAAFPYEPI